MTAAYRLKGLGWFGAIVGVVLGFYLVSLQVAAERKKLADVDARIAAAQRDIRALETEFDTRANLAQLEKWNGDTLALAAPTAAQFVGDEAQLASIDVNAPGLPGVQTAALVVPSGVAQPIAAAAVALPVTQAVAVAAAPVVSVPVVSAKAKVVAATRPAPLPVAARVAAPSGRDAPAMARLAEADRGAAAVAHVRPQAVAMLDRKLLSDTTFSALASGARAESGRFR